MTDVENTLTAKAWRVMEDRKAAAAGIDRSKTGEEGAVGGYVLNEDLLRRLGLGTGLVESPDELLAFAVWVRTAADDVLNDVAANTIPDGPSDDVITAVVAMHSALAFLAGYHARRLEKAT